MTFDILPTFFSDEKRRKEECILSRGQIKVCGTKRKAESLLREAEGEGCVLIRGRRKGEGGRFAASSGGKKMCCDKRKEDNVWLQEEERKGKEAGKEGGMYHLKRKDIKSCGARRKAEGLRRAAEGRRCVVIRGRRKVCGYKRKKEKGRRQVCFKRKRKGEANTENESSGQTDSTQRNDTTSDEDEDSQYMRYLRNTKHEHSEDDDDDDDSSDHMDGHDEEHKDDIIDTDAVEIEKEQKQTGVAANSKTESSGQTDSTQRDDTTSDEDEDSQYMHYQGNTTHEHSGNDDDDEDSSDHMDGHDEEAKEDKIDNDEVEMKKEQKQTGGAVIEMLCVEPINVTSSTKHTLPPKQNSPPEPILPAKGKPKKLHKLQKCQEKEQSKTSKQNVPQTKPNLCKTEKKKSVKEDTMIVKGEKWFTQGRTPSQPSSSKSKLKPKVSMETSQELLKKIQMISPLYASMLNGELEIDKMRRIHGHVKDMISTLVVKLIDNMSEDEHEPEVEEQRIVETPDEPDENEPSNTESVLYQCAVENTDNFMSEWQKANQEVSHLLNRNAEIVVRATKLPQCDIPSMNFQPDIDGIVVELTSFAGITFPLTHISILRNDFNSLENIYPKLKKHLDLRHYSEKNTECLSTV
ncbi:probable serine/threonine-protein kinase kinX [Mytilus trossulus]|uniref:probable serine/threonine-protein kinase kinX n=1 Tax=Mytilus trossulus TaxID=6551 RepID=UPI0030069087